MKRSRPLPHRSVVSLTAPLVLVLACFGTETDNPVSSAPPGGEASESPIQFETGNEPSGCVPDGSDGPPRLSLWAEDGRLLVGWDDGLVVIDASDPGAPHLLARVPIDGYPRQVLLEPNTVTLAIDQSPDIADAPPGPLETITRLIRFDITRPEAPARIAELTLEGEFWQLVPQPGGYWLMSGRLDPSVQRCEIEPGACRGIPREAIVLDRVTFSGGALARGERIELPYVSRVFMSAGGFATLAADAAGGGKLHAALFDGSGGLLPLTPFDVDYAVYGAPAPIELSPDRIVVFGQTVSVYDVAGRRLGGVDPGVVVGPESHVAGDGVFVARNIQQEEGAYIDFSVPSAPVVTPLTGISEVLPIEEPGGGAPRRALGWYQGQNVELTLLSLETSPPTVLDRLETAYDVLDDRADVWLDGARGFLLAYDTGGGLVLGAIDWAGDNLSLHAPIAEDYAGPAFEVGGYSYVLGGGAVQVAALGGSTAAAIELGLDQVLDVAASAAGEARLVVEPDASRRLDVERDGIIQSVPVSAAAQRVLSAGDRWLVLEIEPGSSCEGVGGGCEPPFVTVVGGAPASVLSRIDLPLADVPPLGPASSVTQQWFSSDDYGAGPVALSGGRWALVRELYANCSGQADCDALGVRAFTPEEAALQGVSVATPAGCPPEGPGAPEPCQEQPELPSELGWGYRRAFFVIDPSTGSIGAPASIDAQGGSYFAPGLRLGSAPDETLLSLRIEPRRALPGEPRRGRFVLDRIQIGGDGPVNAGSNVVPGYPVGLLDAGTLISVQPTAESRGAARLVRSELGTLGVAIDAERSIEARYVDAVLAGGHAIVLRTPSDPCAGTTTLASSRLDGDLPTVSSIELPGAGVVVAARGSEVIVSDRGQRFTRVHVAEDGTLSVAAEASASGPLYDVEWRDGSLYGLANGKVTRLTL